RCGTCSTTRSDQAAWPAMDSCGCCSSRCCDCSVGCKDQVRIACGKDVTVVDPCSGRSRIVYIADCGPCQKASCAGCSPEVCGRSCSNCGITRYTPVIDLTKPTFIAFGYDPAVRGCFPCTVRVTIPCS